MAKSLFITATGTDIGKTYVSGLIVKKMRDYGFNCGYYKPVLSGAIRINNELTPGDCVHVVKTAGLNIEPMNCLSYCFEDAVSPHLASKKSGITIDISKILTDYKKLSADYDYILTEGAGGITCPIIDDKYLMWNLIKDLGLNTLVVADGGLGTINSVLTTVEYMQNRDISIKGIVLNNFDKEDFMHRDNLEMVEKMTGIKVIATVGKDDNDLSVRKEFLEGLFE